MEDGDPKKYNFVCLSPEKEMYDEDMNSDDDYNVNEYDFEKKIKSLDSSIYRNIEQRNIDDRQKRAAINKFLYKDSIPSTSAAALQQICIKPVKVMQQQNKKPVTQHAMRPRKVMVPEQQKQQQQNKNPIIQLATTQQPIKQVKYLMVPRQEKQQQQQNTQQIEKPQTIKPVKKMVPMQQQKQQPNKKPAIQITTTQQPIKPKSQQPKSQQHLKAVNFVMEPQQQLDGAPVLTEPIESCLLNKSDFEGHLCDLVLERKPLYSHLTHVSTRTAGAKVKLWDEVVSILNSMYLHVDLELCQGTWKKLRDSYRRYYTQKQSTKSGSKTIVIDQPKFYEKLKALEETYVQRKTSGNVSEADAADENGHEENGQDENEEERNAQGIEQDLESSRPAMGGFPPKKRQKPNRDPIPEKPNHLESFLEPLKTATALLQQQTPEPEDDVHFYCERIKHRLRSIDTMDRWRIELQIDQILYDYMVKKNCIT